MITTTHHNMTEKQKEEFNKMFRDKRRKESLSFPSKDHSRIRLMDCISKVTVGKIIGLGHVARRKLGNCFHKESTTKETLSLFRAYNR